jgi:hypothetical protein
VCLIAGQAGFQIGTNIRLEGTTKLYDRRKELANLSELERRIAFE